MRIVMFELHDQDSGFFDEIMEMVKRHPDIEYLRIKDEPMLSFSVFLFLLVSCIKKEGVLLHLLVFRISRLATAYFYAKLETVLRNTVIKKGR